MVRIWLVAALALGLAAPAEAFRARALPLSRRAPSRAGAASRPQAQPAARSGRGMRMGVPALQVAAALANPRTLALGASAAASVVALLVWLARSLTTPQRQYSASDDFNSVQAEYNAWTNDGILEYYWGEHIHLGYYTDAELAAGYKKKDFIQAKYDFIDEQLKWSGAPSDIKSVLDVGCGIGGTSRYLAKKFPEATVTGISISDAQIARATKLASAQGVLNAKFELKDALKMDFPDNSFDLVWAIESGEHMPDKKRYVEEMARVLKPGGTLVFATWCQRETPPEFNQAERKTLDFLYGEWTHPYFISIEEYTRLMSGTGVLENVNSDDWVKVRRARCSAVERARARGPRALWLARAERRAPLSRARRASRRSAGDHRELAAFDLGGRVGPVDRGQQAVDVVENRARRRHARAHAPRLRLRPHAVRHA